MSNPPDGPARGGFPPPPALPPAGYPPYPSYPPGWPAPPADPLVPADLGGWFDTCFRLFKRSFWRLSLVALIIGGVLLVVFGACLGATLLLVRTETTAGVPASGAAAIPVVAIALLIAFVVVAAGQSASIYLAVMDAAGRHATIGEALRFGAGTALPLFGWYVLATIALVIGFVLLIVPGVYLAVVLSASLACAVVIERTGVARCFELIRGRFWVTFGRLALGWLITQAYQLVAEIVIFTPFAAVASLIFTANSAGPGIVKAIIVYLFAVVGLAVLVLPGVVANTAITVVTYAELRGRENPSTTTQRFADELARS
jgi:hypothetical protein